MHEPGPVEWDESETRPQPMPGWARGCCLAYVIGMVVVVASAGYAIVLWLT